MLIFQTNINTKHHREHYGAFYITKKGICAVHIGIMSTETENNLMDKRKEPLDKNWKSSTIKYDTQLLLKTK